MYPLRGHAKSGMLVYVLYISVRIVFDGHVGDTSKEKKDPQTYGIIRKVKDEAQ